jgi:zona occludens toxin
MAIIVYTGVMGSGKTYEAVSTAALTALRQGRRVVTNISGFNYEAIREHLGEFKDGSHLDPDRVLVVNSSRITEPYFFYDPDVVHDSVVKPGDLVLIDEVWAFWGTGLKLSTEHQKFFRMHRHYSEIGTGTSCDLVIMIQDLGSLHRFIRGVVQSTFKFSKMVTLGLTSRYRVEVYEGNKQSRATLVSANVNKYDKKIFPLYKSYDGADGKEKSVDDRQNLFANKWFLAVFAVALVVLIWAGWWLFSWIGHMIDGGKDAKPVQPAVAQVASVQTGQGVGSSPMSPGAVPIASDHRLVSVLESNKGQSIVIFQTPEGKYIRKEMDSGLIDGWQTTAGFQGRMVGFSFGASKK